MIILLWRDRMKDYNSFDILGPVMVGPSSSHTAGAARLGKIAKEIADKGFYEVEFVLHGSFSMTYKGHGTDKALVAGILGMEPDDENIKNSFNIASDQCINFRFSAEDLGYEHPNTVKIIFKYKDRNDFYIIGSSIGGGSIVITNINGIKIEFTGDKPTILLRYEDRKGVISEISSILANNDLNIATMKVTREKNIATMVCEVDTKFSENVIEEISSMKPMLYMKFINPVKR